MTLGRRIQKVRKELGMTQEKFGASLGISGSAIGMIENGINTPSEQTILSICRVYQVNEVWLRMEKGEPYISKETFRLEDLLREQNLQEDEQELVKKFVRMFCALLPATRRDILRRFDEYFGDTPEARDRARAEEIIKAAPKNPPTHDLTPDETDAAREAEADEVSARIREQILSGGKKASESGLPPAGNGTA